MWPLDMWPIHEYTKSEYDQEIPQSPIADQPTAPWGRATEHLQLQDIHKTIKEKQPALSSFQQSQLLDKGHSTVWSRESLKWSFHKGNKEKEIS